MKRFASQFLITFSGPVLKRPVISVDDSGMILSVEDTGGELKEDQNIEFHNGIIIPGFVNCHCHLELSHMRGIIPEGGGLDDFVEKLQVTRISDPEKIESAAFSGDSEMFKTGVSLCADICNTTHTFRIKQQSRIKYLNLVEIFGIDPSRAEKRVSEAMALARESEKARLDYTFVPHAPYSISIPLFNYIRELSAQNKVTSIHFMESNYEKEFFEKQSGRLMQLYLRSGYLKGDPMPAKDHADIVLNKITPSGNLILVHNTYTDRETIQKIKSRGSLFWCLCPRANLYIEKKLPPVELLREEGCEIVVGTDSLASNRRLSILEELKLIQKNFPDIMLTELVKWATVNGAKAMNMEKEFGKIEAGRKPGLLLIEDADMINMKLTPESSVKRLI